MLGWAKSILFNPVARDQFESFFKREDTFTLGVCNGCQMLSTLHELIPGAEHWPKFVRNESAQFEERLVQVEVQKSNSILLVGMEGSRMPIMMPHPERVYRTVQHSWHPDEWQEQAPWLRLFQNARKWLG